MQKVNGVTGLTQADLDRQAAALAAAGLTAGQALAMVAARVRDRRQGR